MFRTLIICSLVLASIPVVLSGAELPASKTGVDSAPMILIPSGAFTMGSTNEPDEMPAHRVMLPDYYIDKYEVTCGQYARFLKATGRKAPIDWPGGVMPAKWSNNPVVNVTFADAEAYAKWAGKRLPTEQEWEKAARGTDERFYPWGNTMTGKKIASPTNDNSKDRMSPVGNYPDDASPYGVMDMSGNAWEWTTSWYDAYPGNDQLELEYGKKYRVIRGGGAIDYYGAFFNGRCTDRARSLPYGTYDGLGFRCIMEAK